MAEPKAQVRDNTRAQTALELMKHIASSDIQSGEQQGDRKYWFELYRQCYKAVSGRRLSVILKDEAAAQE